VTWGRIGLCEWERSSRDSLLVDIDHAINVAMELSALAPKDPRFLPGQPATQKECALFRRQGAARWVDVVAGAGFEPAAFRL
jgi:hypothetical protein